MTKRNVRTFDDLAKYATERARKSAARNDPIAWAYWRATEGWATTEGKWLREDKWPDAICLMQRLRDSALAEGWEDPFYVAHLYARCKWLCILARNRGTPLKRLSLAWLHKIERVGKFEQVGA